MPKSLIKADDDILYPVRVINCGLDGEYHAELLKALSLKKETYHFSLLHRWVRIRNRENTFIWFVFYDRADWRENISIDRGDFPETSHKDRKLWSQDEYKASEYKFFVLAYQPCVIGEEVVAEHLSHIKKTLELLCEYAADEATIYVSAFQAAGTELNVTMVDAVTELVDELSSQTKQRKFKVKHVILDANNQDALCEDTEELRNRIVRVHEASSKTTQELARQRGVLSQRVVDVGSRAALQPKASRT